MRGDNMMKWDFNKIIWEAQPRKAKIIQSIIIFPLVALMAYVVVFDTDDTHGLMKYCIFGMIPIGITQLLFWVRDFHKD